VAVSSKVLVGLDAAGLNALANLPESKPDLLERGAIWFRLHPFHIGLLASVCVFVLAALHPRHVAPKHLPLRAIRCEEISPRRSAAIPCPRESWAGISRRVEAAP
jgi:hypothetical protein